MIRFRKMRPVRNRNTKRNAHPSRHRHCRRCRFRRNHALTLAALRIRHCASDSSVDGWLLCRLSPLACCVVLHPVISCFQEFIFWTKKTFLPGFLRIPFLPVFSRGIFHRNLVLERSQEFLFFFCCHSNFSQEFLWDRNSCIYPGILQIPEDSGGFLFPPKAAGSGQRIKKALC